MEKIASVDTGESPIESCLVLVMSGTEFRQDALTIGCEDGVEVGSKVRTGVLSD